VSRNLTLTIDEELIRAARKVALDRNTSVNNLVRGFLETLVAESGEQRAAMIQIEEVFKRKPFVVGKKNWTRAELHER
jgi:Family of unknown function (DUF6364)